MINKVAFKLGIPDRMPWLVPILNIGRLRPEFFLIGFQKCGTSTVYSQIMKSITVVPGLLKENNELSKKNGDLQKFLLSFPYRWKGEMTGDGSHLNSFTPYGLPRITKHFPKAKLIVIMRDPIKRMVSHIKMDQRIGYIPESWSIEDYIDAEMTIRRGLNAPYSLEENYYRLKVFGSRYGWAITRSMYIIYMTEILKSNNPLHIMFLEDLESNYAHEMTKLFSFLGIEEQIPSEDLTNRGEYDFELSDALQARLIDIFSEPNELLRMKLHGHSIPWDY